MPKLFYKIGEVSRLADVEPYILRYWESEFPALAPKKNRGGQRVYLQSDLEMVLRIKRMLHQEGYTIAGARKKLADIGHAEPKGSKPSGVTEAALSDKKLADAIVRVKDDIKGILELIK